MPTKAEMEKILEQVVEEADGEGQAAIADLARRALGRKDTVNEVSLYVCLECFETHAGPEDTLEDDLEVTVTYRGKPVQVSSVNLRNYTCERLEDQEADGEEEDEE